jgi:hypothetical protein
MGASQTSHSAGREIPLANTGLQAGGARPTISSAVSTAFVLVPTTADVAEVSKRVEGPERERKPLKRLLRDFARKTPA